MSKITFSAPDLSATEILRNANKNAVSDIIILESTDSTNIFAKKLTADGALHNTVVIANTQTAGHGRYGRSFFSPSDTGLYMSIVQKPDSISIPPSLLTIAAGVAVCRTVSRFCPETPQIKWVNDIFLNKRKVCGILAEAGSSSQGLDYIIAGIGLNVSTKSENFPKELKEVAGSITTQTSRSCLAADIINELDILTTQTGTKELIDEYKSLSLVLGKEVTFCKNGTEYEGIASDINLEGSLVVTLRDKTLLTVRSGEISLGSLNFI